MSTVLTDGGSWRRVLPEALSLALVEVDSLAHLQVPSPRQEGMALDQAHGEVEVIGL